ncbi:5-(carboxyamino)imidazole ribonucleotide synthase [Buchananella felis]|uniref:5-(carboxyamino)imidazole ribonucleotide synthase n=1 Tax=Buchananella felis TaxID=3231492 RepID=UPI003526FF9B
MPTLAVIGGGQLARMMHAPATALGVKLQVLVEAADGSAGRAIPDSIVGMPKDDAAVQAVCAGADAVTFEHEHIPPSLFAAAGVEARPAQEALLYARNKLEMRRKLTEIGVPCPRWAQVTGPADFERFWASVGGGEVVAKTAVGGYDGKGVAIVSSYAQIEAWVNDPACGGVLLEEKVDFQRELAALVARRPSGQCVAWPVVETQQVGGVCDTVIAPAPELSEELAQQGEEIARQIATELGVTGVLAVEMFQAGQRLLVNELAMRPHNSGHWTIDGCATSQFEQHIRATLDLPLGPTEMTAPVSVMVNILGSDVPDPASHLAQVWESYPQAKVHLYGKEVRPGRKLGHVNATGSDLAQALQAARAAANLIMGRK